MSESASRCRLCGDSLAQARRMRIDPAPLSAQAFSATMQGATSAARALLISECGRCGLVQALGAPVDDFRFAISAAGVSAAMRDHRLAQARRLRDRCAVASPRLALIGCGEGYELEILSAAGFAPAGIEFGGARSGAHEPYAVHDGYPMPESRLPGAPYDAFACYNFLEHAPDPTGFLRGIAESLAVGGIGVVEVPNYAQQREQERTFDYVADHLSYFDHSSLRTALTFGGFLVDELRVVRGGENIEAIVRRREPTPLQADAAAIVAARDALVAFLRSARQRGENAAIWGASHQALTLTATLDPALVVGIFDSSPAKQGRFAPPSGIPVLAPAAAAIVPLGVVVIIASGYELEIRERLVALGFTGRVAVVRGARVVDLD